jgi:hypothetical protein
MVLAALLACAISSTLAIAHAGTRTRTIYHAGDATLTIVGRGCFSQEDVTKLKLVAYESPTELTYRCVTP